MKTTKDTFLNFSTQRTSKVTKSKIKDSFDQSKSVFWDNRADINLKQWKELSQKHYSLSSPLTFLLNTIYLRQQKHFKASSLKSFYSKLFIYDKFPFLSSQWVVNFSLTSVLIFILFFLIRNYDVTVHPLKWNKSMYHLKK